MGHGYITVFGYGILLNVNDIIVHLIKQIENISNQEEVNEIDIDDYDFDIDEILERFNPDIFNFHYEGQCQQPNDIFITLKEYSCDARGACGSYTEIDMNELIPTDNDLKMFKEIQLKLIGEAKFKPKLSAFSYETS